MLDGLRNVARVIERGARKRWLLLFALAVAVSVSEIVGAFLIFVLLGLISSPDAAVQLPVIGDVRALFPNVADRDLVAYVAGFVACFFVVRGALYLIQSYLQNRVAQNLGVQLSSRLLRGYLRMPYARHLERNSAELVRTAFSSVNEIVAGVLIPVVAVIAESLIVLGVFAALLLVAPAVTLLAALSIGLLVLFLLRVIQPRMASLGVLNQEVIGTTYKVLQQSLEGVRDIKVLGREPYFERQFSQSRATAARTMYLRNVLLDAPRAVVETALVILIVVFLVVAVRRSTQPQDLLAVLGLFAYAVLRVLPSVNRIVANANSIRYGGAAVDLVLADLDALDTGPWQPLPSQPTLPFERCLEVSHVSFAFSPDGPLVLDVVDLTVRRGESIGVVGPTGAGKSTLLDVVLGLLRPTHGQVLVDGVDVQSDLTGWHRQLGVVPQLVFLVDDTLRGNIALGEGPEEIDEQALRDAVRIAQLEDVVAGLDQGLDTVVGERGVRLSGGQRQRVAIARALYRRPSILVFDEGTSALDARTEAAFTASLEALHGEKTIFTVAHRLGTVRNHDRIVVLEHGRVADIGTYDELLARSSTFRSIAG